MDHVQGPVQHPQPAAARGRGAQLQPVHGDHAEHQRQRDRRVQPGLGQPGRPRGQAGRRQLRARSRQAQEDRAHRHAHARQRDRHQLLRRQEGAGLQPAPPSGGPGHHGLPGRAARAAHPVRHRCRGAVRRHLDGSRVLLRLLGLDRAGRRAWPLQHLQGLAVGSRRPAAGLAQAAGAGARRLSGGRPVVDDGLGWSARAHPAARHAQLQLRGDRSDGDDLQHHRRVRMHRADVPEPVRQVEPVGRVHGGQRLPGARPEGTRPVG